MRDINATELAAVRLCVCGNVRRAARSVTQFFDDALQPSGLRITQFAVLVAIARQGPTKMTLLAEALGMDRTTLTRNLEPLERQGWVENVHVEDERARLVALTEAGRATLAAALPLWKQAQAQVVDELGQGRLTSLLTDLATLDALA